MVKDFTEATKERLKGKIDEINKKTWCPVTDAIGDVALYLGKWMGVLSLKDDMSNIEAYQRRVLDMTDMTKDELERIFSDVYSVDLNYSGYFRELAERAGVYNEKLIILYSMIGADFTICSASEIKTFLSASNAKLNAIDGKLNATFKKELDWSAKNTSWKAAKGLFGGIIGLAVDVVILPAKMLKNIVTGQPQQIFADAWGVCDNVFEIAGNLSSLAAVGLGYGISAITGTKETMHKALKWAEPYAGASGLTDVLEADEKIHGKDVVTSTMLTISRGADIASDAINLWGDAKDFLEDPSKMIDSKFGFEGKPGTIKKADMLSEYQEEYRKYQSTYRKLTSVPKYTRLKNLKNAYGYVEAGWDVVMGKSEEEILENTIKKPIEKGVGAFKALEDAYDLGEKLVDYGEGLS